MNSIDEALSQIEQVVIESGNTNDLTYFMYHRSRFKKMGDTVIKLCKPGATVLDIGSHFLHSSLLLSFLGYKVVSMDVSEFGDLDYIKNRALTHHLTPIIENNLEKLESLTGHENQFDLILFTEIFEHITFNPIGFWKRVYTLIKDDGVIYITTPNSLTLYAIAKTIFNLLRFRGIGIGVNAIFQTVTYGHHWKEYSASEVKAYFKKMNDGFKVSISKFYYKSDPADGSLKSRMRIFLMNVGNKIPFFRDGMEVVVRVNKSFPWKVDTPKY